MNTAVEPSIASSTVTMAAQIAHRTVWAMMTTVDANSRPRNRLVHPVWVVDGELLTGWLATRPTPLKSRHLANNPYVSLAYVAPNHDLAYFDCLAEWVRDAPGKQRCWDAFLYADEPVRYDPATIWPTGPDSASFAVLKFSPYRVQAGRAADIAAGQKLAMTRFEVLSRD